MMRLFQEGSAPHLVGREQECAVLTHLFQKIQQPHAPVEMCLVHGEGGAGKTSVIRHVAKEQQQQVETTVRNGINHDHATTTRTKKLRILSGKFDQYQDFSAPYSEIVNAFEQLLVVNDANRPPAASEAATINAATATTATPSASVSGNEQQETAGDSSRKRGDDKNKEIRDRIKKCITTEARILTRIVPSFRKLMLEEEEETNMVGRMNNPAASEHDNDGKGTKPNGGKIDSNINKRKKRKQDSFGDCVVGTGATTGGGEMLTLAVERLTVAFRVFLREFCSEQYPIVLFMDDLQWSDENTCRLLGQIANDPSIENFMLIGCYRDEGSAKVLNWLGLSDEEEWKNRVTDIPIGPLDVSGVDSLVGMIVSLDNRSLGDDSDNQSYASASELGMLVHRKTQGNPYFVVQFLEMLHSTDLLTYNYGTHRWEFALAEIEETTSISENVVDVLRARIGQLSPQVQRVLVIAAFLGFMLDTQLLEVIAHDFGTMDWLILYTATTLSGNTASTASSPDANGSDDKLPEKKLTTAEALKIAQEEGLIEISNNAAGGICRFSHDRIQECFFDLVPEGQKQHKLHYEIGMHVWRQYLDKGDADHAYIFLAADQLNRGAGFIRNDDDRIFLIEVNYKASLVAKNKVGIETVGLFLDNALDHVSTLGDSTTFWEEKYDLFLNLYSFAAEVEFCRGNFERNDAHVDAVITFARQKADAVRVLVCRALAYGVRREFMQAIKESRKLLKLLGVKMPPSLTPSILIELIKAKGAVKKKSDEYILNMKPMKDENMKLAMKILHHGSIFGWNSDTTFAGLCFLRMVRLTVQHGWCEVTPFALAGYGFMLAALGEETEAFRFSQLSTRSSRSKRALPEVQMMVGAFLSHFERPAALSLPPLIDGYRSGLESGGMMCGTICMSVYAHVYLFSGLSLTSFAKDMLQFSAQLKLCHQDLALAFVLPALQLALNLGGKTDDPMDVSIKSMQQLDGYNDSMFVDTMVEDPTVLFVYYLQAFSAYLLGDLGEAERAFDRIYGRKKTRLDGTQILNIFFISIDGLVSLALRREKGRTKYNHLSRSSIKALETLTRKRSVNTSGILALMQAENDSFSVRKTDILKNKYAYAIQQLTRSGFLHYTAIANELAGAAMHRRGDEYWTEYYLMEAAVKYTEWGAVAKVEQMKSKYPSINFETRQTRISSAIHSREWFDVNVDSVEARQSWASSVMMKSSSSSAMVKSSSSRSPSLFKEQHSLGSGSLRASFGIPEGPDSGTLSTEFAS